MNFDFEYATTEAANYGGGINVDWRLIGIIAAIIVGITIVVALILWIINMKKENRRNIVNIGTVFCNRCYNEYDAALSKCQYCNNKKIRRDDKYGFY